MIIEVFEPSGRKKGEKTALSGEVKSILPPR